MKIISTKFEGLKIIKQKNNLDKRGSLREIHNQKIINFNDFIFEYCTTSKSKVLRGFHFQYKFQQAKYVNVLKGKILDCVIDLRKKSKTFGKTFKIILSDKNCLSLYIPKSSLNKLKNKPPLFEYPTGISSGAWTHKSISTSLLLSQNNSTITLPGGVEDDSSSVGGLTKGKSRITIDMKPVKAKRITSLNTTSFSLESPKSFNYFSKKKNNNIIWYIKK